MRADNEVAADSSSTPVLRFEIRDHVAYLTLDRPQALNALSLELMDCLDVALDRISADNDIRAVVIAGSGNRAFCSGVDLKELQEKGIQADTGGHLRFSARLHGLLRKLEWTPVPVIAVIRGYALAGGLELALSCDLIVCSDDARIGDEHANKHLIAGAGGTQRLPRRIGQPRALELLYTGRRLTGPEAVECGLALFSRPAGELDNGVEELVARLRSKSRVALGYTKQAVKRGSELPLRDALDLERLIVDEYTSGYPDARDGVAAFVQSRAQRH